MHQICCQFHWHTGNGYSAELLDMLVMFLLGTGSLNDVLVLTECRKSKTTNFFSFMDVIVTHSYQYDVDSDMFFLVPENFPLLSSFTQSGLRKT